jgi:type IV pilus assembly protein PilN
LRNTANNSEWLVRPELVEIRVSGAGKDQKRLFDFGVRLTIKRPQDKAAEVLAPANAASAPASAVVAKKA